MYTPTPPSKRPRPPNSSARLRIRNTSLTAATSQPLAAVAVAEGLASMASDKTLVEAAVNRYSPSAVRLGNPTRDTDIEVEDISMELQPDAGPSSSPFDPVSRSIPSAPSLALHSRSSRMMAPANQPSPPPPYPRDLPITDSADLGSPARPSGARCSTPPRQDTDDPNRKVRGSSMDEADQAEEQQRQERAMEAAKAMGLDIDFDVTSACERGEESDGLSDGEVRKRLKSAQKRLRQRDNELVMAAQIAQQALQTHEELVSRLSPRARERLPSFLNLLAQQQNQARARHTATPSPRPAHQRHSSALSVMSVDSVISPPSSRNSICTSPTPVSPPNGLRMLRILDGMPMPARRSHKHRAGHVRTTSQNANDSPLRKELYMAHLQQRDMDQRIAELEAALADAQEGQEAQRKAAARLRKENEQVHRNLARAEQLLGEANTLRGMPVPSARGRRETAFQAGGSELKWTSSRAMPGDYNETERSQRAATEGSAQSQLEGEVDRLLDGLEEIDPRSRSRSTSPVVFSESASRPCSTSEQRSNTSSETTPPIKAFIDSKKVRRKVSPSAFLSPSTARENTRERPCTPSVMIQPPASDPPSPVTPLRQGTVKRKSSRLSIRTTGSINTPTSMPMSPVESITSLASLASRLPLSPGYTSLSTRMASMRDYVAKHLGNVRTLDSELGMKHDAVPIEPSMRGELNNDEQEWEDEIPERDVNYLEHLLISDLEGEGSPFSSPAALPPQISAALSSMASAMRPGGMFRRPGRSTAGHTPKKVRSVRTASKVRARKDIDGRVDASKPASSGKLPGSPAKRRFARSPGPLALRRLKANRPFSIEVDVFSPTESTFLSINSPQQATIERKLISGRNETMARITDDWHEPKTIPGRIVHDLYVWMMILMEWAVYLFVMIVKAGLDLHEAKTGIREKNRNDQRRKRYYL